VKRGREDNAKHHGALSPVALCFTTGTQLPVHSCYIMLITITTTCLHLTFKGSTLFRILGSVRVTLPHIGNIWRCFSNQQAAYMQTIRSVIVGRVFAYFSLLAAWIAFTRIYVSLNRIPPFTHTLFSRPLSPFLPLSSTLFIRLSFILLSYLVSFLCSLIYLFLSH
jgi:hypothetical protein